MAVGVKGRFITFEGFEGSGKSTQARLLCRYLSEKKHDVLHIREPGGVGISEQIRGILLDVNNRHMASTCETLLYMAARAQLVSEKIIPALEKGITVVCDRFLDSTVAYQGYGCGVDIPTIKRIGRFITRGVRPDVTFLIDINVNEGLRRTGCVKDRIEQRSLTYHNRVRRGYLDMSKKEPRRIILIDGRSDKDAIQSKIRDILHRKWKF